MMIRLLKEFLMQNCMVVENKKLHVIADYTLTKVTIEFN